MKIMIMMIMKTARCKPCSSEDKKRKATNAANRREINVNEPVTGIYKVNQIKPKQNTMPDAMKMRTEGISNAMRPGKKMEKI